VSFLNYSFSKDQTPKSTYLDLLWVCSTTCC